VPLSAAPTHAPFAEHAEGFPPEHQKSPPRPLSCEGQRTPAPRGNPALARSGASGHRTAGSTLETRRGGRAGCREDRQPRRSSRSGPARGPVEMRTILPAVEAHRAWLRCRRWVSSDW
jgi:hypothetical protein